jgi:hypothetical protein
MARSFDGTLDRVTFGTSASQFLTTFTATAWVKFPSNFTAERTILAKFDSGYLGKLYLKSGGVNQNDVQCYLTRVTTAQNSRSAADVLTAGVWNFVCATCDTTNAPKIYTSVAGTAAAEVSYANQQAGSGSYNGTDTTALIVGSRGPLDTYWIGEIAETALWDRVLSADEIRALSLGFAPSFFPRGQLFYAPLVGRYATEPNIPPGGDTWGTVTDAVYADHPPIIYPRKYVSSSPSRTITPRPLVTTMSALRW